MKSVRFSFALRMILFSTAVIAVAVILSSYFSYQQSKNMLEESFSQELKAVVSSVATGIDGDQHELISATENGIEGIDAFESIRSQLMDVRKSVGMDDANTSLYTMRTSEDFNRSGDLEFVVMTDPNEDGVFLIGNRYPVQRHTLSALKGKPMASGLYADEDGVWVSAAAPIENRAGDIVGVVQADRYVNDFYQEARSKSAVILWSAFLSIFIGSVISIFWTRTFMNPIQQLVRANEQVGEGDLSTQVDIDRRDEIGVMGESFNQMVNRLDSLQQRERMMASFAQLNPAPVLSFSTQGKILIANNSSLTLFDREQLVGLSVKDLFAGLADVDLKKLIAEGEIMNYSAKIGTRDFQFVIVGIQDLGIGQMYGTDISDLKTAEKEIQQARDRAELKAGQLVETVKELQRFNQVSVDRELRMIELKQEINALHEAAGRAPVFDLSVFQETESV